MYRFSCDFTVMYQLLRMSVVTPSATPTVVTRQRIHRPARCVILILRLPNQPHNSVSPPSAAICIYGSSALHTIPRPQVSPILAPAAALAGPLSRAHSRCPPSPTATNRHALPCHTAPGSARPPVFPQAILIIRRRWCSAAACIPQLAPQYMPRDTSVVAWRASAGHKQARSNCRANTAHRYLN